MYSAEKEKIRIDIKGYGSVEPIIPNRPFRNLVIEGGGVGIIPVVGSLKVLYSSGLCGFTKFAGSSAGAITVALLAAGYTTTELEHIFMYTDFRRFLDDDYGIIRDLYRLFTGYGWHRGDYFTNWMDDMISKKTGKTQTTFKDIWTLKKKEIHITSLCIEDNKTVIFDHNSHPNLPVSKAVRMSMSIPFVFTAVLYEGKHYIDGGVSYNYPLNIFDTDLGPSYETIGLKVMGRGETRDKLVTRKTLDASNPLAYTTSIVSHMLTHIERKEIDPAYWSRTITVDSGDIGVLEFDIPLRKRVEYIKKASLDTRKALDKYYEFGRF